MRALLYFRWLHDKRGGFLGKIIHDDPEVAHDLFKVCTKWNWIPFAQSLHLNADKLSTSAVVRNDVDPAAFLAVGITFQPRRER